MFNPKPNQFIIVIPPKPLTPCAYFVIIKHENGIFIRCVHEEDYVATQKAVQAAEACAKARLC